MKILVSVAFLVITLVLNSSGAIAGEKLTYRIVKETTNEKFSKKNLDVELNIRTDKATLEKIAKSLRSTRKRYKRLWIAYYLPGMQHGAGSWAISHFTPNLEVEILGTTVEEDKRLRAVTINRKDVIGKWLDDRPLVANVIIIFKKSGKLIMKNTFKDGSSGEYKLIVKQVHGKTKYQSIEDTFGEYYMLEHNGNLGMYSPNGKFSEAMKIK